ncbi:cupin domain-containing protein [Parvularcula flava]|nr:cupin domain-containing protein [Aquisalinus luteolus]
MVLNENGSRASVAGPSQYFTGNARIDPIHMEAKEPSRITSARVTFDPGARTNWHSHPLGQLIVVTSGQGWTQTRGGERVEINAGDTIWCKPGCVHWHGGTKDTGMAHLVVQEALEGANVEWLEPVSDEDYLGTE